jgi:hypothetical protein
VLAVVDHDECGLTLEILSQRLGGSAVGRKWRADRDRDGRRHQVAVTEAA